MFLRRDVMEQENSVNMDNKEVRRKIFTVIYAVALVALLSNVVIVLYNSIDMFSYRFVDQDRMVKSFQIPLAVISLLGFVFSVAALVSGVLIIYKNDKKSAFILKIITVSCIVAIVVLMIASGMVWKKYVDYWWSETSEMHDVRNNTQYALLSVVMTNLLTQTVYLFILAALQILPSLIAGIKNKKNKNKGDSLLPAAEVKTLPEANPGTEPMETDA